MKKSNLLLWSILLPRIMIWIYTNRGSFRTRFILFGQMILIFWMSTYFQKFYIFFVFKKHVTPPLIKLERSSLKDTLCHIWLKLVQWIGKKWKGEKFTTTTTTTTKDNGHILIRKAHFSILHRRDKNRIRKDNPIVTLHLL